MSEVNDWNRNIIDEFRTHEGKVSGQFDGWPILLLHTTGAKTGAERVNPLVYHADGDRLVVFASKGGAPTNPDWYHNLVAHPRVTVEVGTETYEATATPLTGEERDRLYAKQASLYPQFGEYQARATRKIPVIALERHKG